MQIFNRKTISKLLLSVITLSLILSVLTSCNLFAYVADSKDEISNNVNDTSEDNRGDYDYVYEHLRKWGLPKFDTTKFMYFESCFTQVYNYEGGLPDTYTHAKEVANSFLEHYYDTIDLEDKSAVTNALLTCYVYSLDDPYSMYRPPEETDKYNNDMSGKFGGIGVVVEYDYDAETIMVSTVYIDSPAEKAGVQVGDYLYAVDGKTVDELGFNNAVYYVRGEIGTYVELTLLRNGEYVTLSVLRAEVEEINAAYTFDEETGIGYVQIVSFKDNTFAQFAEAIDSLEDLGARGIIFDLRNNPGGYVYSVQDVLSYLIPTGKVIMSYQYKGYDATEIFSETDKVADTDSDHVIDLPIVVLCNEYTASAGEIFTAAVRDYREAGLLNATIVGTNTYGKGIMQNSYQYIDGSSVTMTVAYYNPPCGVNYHGVGVAPDRVVEIEDDVDTQYEAAVEELLKLLNND